MLSPRQLQDLRELDSPPSSIGASGGRKWARQLEDGSERTEDAGPANGRIRRSVSPVHARSSSSPLHSPEYSRRSSLVHTNSHDSTATDRTERRRSVVSEDSEISRRADEIINEAQQSALRKMASSRQSVERPDTRSSGMSRQHTQGSSSSSTISGSHLNAPSLGFNHYGRSPSPRRRPNGHNVYAPSSSNGSEAFADAKRSSIISLSDQSSPRRSLHDMNTPIAERSIRARLSRANLRGASESPSASQRVGEYMARTLSAVSGRQRDVRDSPERSQTSAGHYDSPTRSSTLTESGRQRFLNEYGDRPYAATVGRLRRKTETTEFPSEVETQSSPRRRARPSLPQEWMQGGLSPSASSSRALTPETSNHSSGRSRTDSISTRRSNQYESPSNLESRRRKISAPTDRSVAEGALSLLTSLTHSVPEHPGLKHRRSRSFAPSMLESRSRQSVSPAPEIGSDDWWREVDSIRDRVASRPVSRAGSHYPESPPRREQQRSSTYEPDARRSRTSLGHSPRYATNGVPETPLSRAQTTGHRYTPSTVSSGTRPPTRSSMAYEPQSEPVRLLNDAVDYVARHLLGPGSEHDTVNLDSNDLARRLLALATTTSKLNADLRQLAIAAADAQADAEVDGIDAPIGSLFQRTTTTLMRASDEQMRTLTETLIALGRRERDRERQYDGSPRYHDSPSTISPETSYTRARASRSPRPPVSMRNGHARQLSNIQSSPRQDRTYGTTRRTYEREEHTMPVAATVRSDSPEAESPRSRRRASLSTATARVLSAFSPIRRRTDATIEASEQAARAEPMSPDHRTATESLRSFRS